MKIKMLVAALLLSGGATGVFAQNDCNANSSISHEAVNSKNFKDAYAPCMAVLKECPTLRYYTFADAMEILRAFLGNIKDRNSADYQKYFNELMEVHDLRMKYIPEFLAKGVKVPSVQASLGTKAIDNMQFAPTTDINQLYQWLKESVYAEKSESKGPILHYFMDMSMQKVRADDNHTDVFFQDYIDASKFADDAIQSATKPAVKKNLEGIKENLEAMFVNSGVADCASLEKIYGPKVETNKTDSTFLKKTLSILKMMRCNESETYFKASDYLYRIDRTADAAVGVAYMYYKKGDFDSAVKYFDEALGMEKDNSKKAEIAYASAVALFNVKKLSQARVYCQKAVGFNENFGKAYMLLAQMYASNPRWNDEPTLNKCTYFLVIDKLLKAKAVDPSIAEDANKLINTYAPYTPQINELFMLGYKAGDRITIGGWIGESTTIR